MKAVLNIERIGLNALRAHARHELREIGDLSHTDPDRRHLNTATGLHRDPERAVSMYLGETGAKIDKRNEKPVTRLLLSASPEYFRPGRTEQRGEFDEERLSPWVKESVAWIKKEFGEDAVHISLHLDETTPHIHAVLVPTYDKKTKRRTVKQVSHHKHPAFSGEGSYERLHDRYAEAIQSLNIQRGERLPKELRGQRRSTTKREWMNEGVKRISAQLSLLDDEVRKRVKSKLANIRAAAQKNAQSSRAGGALRQVRSKIAREGRER